MGTKQLIGVARCSVVEAAAPCHVSTRMVGVAELVRGKSDWNSTALGEPAQWPQSLKTALHRALVAISDGDLLGAPSSRSSTTTRTRSSSARSIRACSARRGRRVGGDLGRHRPDAPERRSRAAKRRGPRIKLLVMNRNGFIEETYFTWSYSPIVGRDGNRWHLHRGDRDDRSACSASDGS